MAKHTYRHKTVILFGMPGAGKTTHAQLLQKMGYPVDIISMGARLREIAQHTFPFGWWLKRVMNRGGTVNIRFVDHLLLQTFKKHDRRRILLLDSYPRDYAQMERIDRYCIRHGLDLPIVINMQITKKEAMRRLSERRVCVDCKRHYLLEELRGKDACRRCGGHLEERGDDAPDAIRHRMQVMAQHLMMLKQYYTPSGRFYTIDAMGGERATHRNIVNVIK